MKLEHDGKMYSYLIHYNGWSKVSFIILKKSIVINIPDLIINYNIWYIAINQ